MHSQTHPYAPLAARAHMSGWQNVKCRRFASDLSVNGVLECVEYVWFTDDRAMVILSRIPLATTEPIVRISEILYFPPVQLNHIPPQRPDLVLRVIDSAVCEMCHKEICNCSNAPALPTTCSDSSAADLSWEQRTRIAYHGKKSGFLTVMYNNTTAQNFSQVTIRQAYVSLCHDQNSIADRIQLHLTRLISSQNQQPPCIENANPAGSDSVQHPEEIIGLTDEPAGNPPITFTPANSIQCEGEWLDASVVKPIESPSKRDDVSVKKQLCSSPNEQAVPAPTESDKADGIKSSADISANSFQSTWASAEASQKDNTEGPVAKSLSGPEKTGKDCECSAETIPDQSLAMILNSEQEHIPSKALTPFNSLIEPSIMTGSNGSSLLLESLPQIGRSLASPDVQVDKAGTECLPPFIATETQSPASGKAGSTPLTPALLRPSILQSDSSIKRSRMDALNKGDIFPFGLESTWSPTYDDAQRTFALPPWTPTGLSVGPGSGLSRTLGIGCTPSPLSLVHQLTKPMSPHSLLGADTMLNFPKLQSADDEFQNATIEPVVVGEDAGNTQNVDEDQKADESAPKRAKFSKGVSSPLNWTTAPVSVEAAETADITNANARSSDNGLCCEICGIRFAKRGNKLRHIQTVHNRVKEFECDQCQTKFGLKADLRRHKLRIHESRAFGCHACGKSFAEQGQLDLHVRSVHEEDSRPFECGKCRIRFGRKSSLTRHEQTVHEQTRFECRVCKKSYSQRFDAIRHERKVHGMSK